MPEHGGFSCYLECGIKKLISQGAGFDVYLLSAHALSIVFFKIIAWLFLRNTDGR